MSIKNACILKTNFFSLKKKCPDIIDHKTEVVRLAATTTELAPNKKAKLMSTDAIPIENDCISTRGRLRWRRGFFLVV